MTWRKALRIHNRRRVRHSLLRGDSGAGLIVLAFVALGVAPVVVVLHDQQDDAAEQLERRRDPDWPQALAHAVDGDACDADDEDGLEGLADVLGALGAVNLDDLRDERRRDEEGAHEPQRVVERLHVGHDG
ncbi:hypothetical protein ON010_g405 [Phytophthora cinnamomi]|nr:hypothetical protein ON010_g405 [Phytophthora cinnamomi]